MKMRLSVLVLLLAALILTGCGQSPAAPSAATEAHEELRRAAPASQ